MRNDRNNKHNDPSDRRPQYGGQPRRDQAAHTDRGERRGAYQKPQSGGRHYDDAWQSRDFGPGPRRARGANNIPAAARIDGDAVPSRPPRPPKADPVRPREELYGEAADKPRLPEAALPEDQENLLVGRNPIREALKAGRPMEKLLVAAGDLSGAARDIVRLAREAGVIVQTVDRSRLDAIYPAHQGMLAYVSMAEYSTVDDILAYARERGEDPFVLLLDGITDPHNLGAIIRTAECAGAHGVVIPERRAAGLGPACAKAAAGALETMRVARVKNLNRTAEELKEEGLWIVATALDGEDVYKADLTGPIALVIGSEGDGVSRLMLERADRRVTLPMLGKIESLNASVAAGIITYEVVRARRG